jgi:hypothetical protein
MMHSLSSHSANDDHSPRSWLFVHRRHSPPNWRSYSLSALGYLLSSISLMLASAGSLDKWKALLSKISCHRKRLWQLISQHTAQLIHTMTGTETILSRTTQQRRPNHSSTSPASLSVESAFYSSWRACTISKATCTLHNLPHSYQVPNTTLRLYARV